MQDAMSLYRLYAAYIAGVKGIPSFAKHREVSYLGKTLLDGNRAVLTYVPPAKKKPGYIVHDTSHGRRYGSWGRASESIGHSALRVIPADLGPTIACDGAVASPLTLAKLLLASGQVNAMLFIAKRHNFALSTILPTKVEKIAKDYYRDIFRQDDHAKAKELAFRMTPAGRKQTRLDNKERKEAEAVKRRKIERNAPFVRAFNEASKALDSLQRGTPDIANLWKAIGYEPQPGDWFKVTGKDGAACSGGSGHWSRPTAGPDGVEGAFMPRIDDVQVCRRGYHLVPAGYVGSWVRDRTCQELYLAAPAFGAKESKQHDKTAFSSARLTRKLAEGDLNALMRPVKDAEALARAQSNYDRAYGEACMAEQGYN